MATADWTDRRVCSDDLGQSGSYSDHWNQKYVGSLPAGCWCCSWKILQAEWVPGGWDGKEELKCGEWEEKGEWAKKGFRQRDGKNIWSWNYTESGSGIYLSSPELITPTAHPATLSFLCSHPGIFMRSFEPNDKPHVSYFFWTKLQGEVRLCLFQPN